MFTGIVCGTGVVESFQADRLRVRMRWTEDVKVGDSVCINGVCLTAVEVGEGYCVFDVMEETRRRSNLGSLRRGDEVNVELALGVGERFGGHFVTGHVDGVGRIRRLEKRASQWDMVVECEKELLSEMVERGSVAVDGVSLTVAELGDGWFRVALIPHTVEATNLKGRRLGDTVNIETDILAKYVKRLLIERENSRRLTEDKLKELGY